MRLKFTLAAILFILFAPTIAFAEVTIKKIPEPQLPEFKGFYVLTQAQSSNISFAKSNIKTTIK